MSTKQFPRWLRSPLLLATCLVLLAAAPPVLADLRSSTLDALLADSEFIVLAQVEALEPAAHGAGSARLKPIEHVRGQGPDGPFTLRWSDEVHDQRVPAAPATLLLFLKHRDGQLLPAQYGRSLWPVESSASGCRRYTRYRYPVDLVRLDAAQRDRLLQSRPAGAGAPAVRILCLDDWASLLTNPSTRTTR